MYHVIAQLAETSGLLFGARGRVDGNEEPTLGARQSPQVLHVSSVIFSRLDADMLFAPDVTVSDNRRSVSELSWFDLNTRTTVGQNSKHKIKRGISFQSVRAEFDYFSQPLQMPNKLVLETVYSITMQDSQGGCGERSARTCRLVLAWPVEQAKKSISTSVLCVSLRAICPCRMPILCQFYEKRSLHPLALRPCSTRRT